MAKSESTLKFKPIARPKYIEEISGNEAAVHQPWEIMMMVQPVEHDESTYPVMYYIRAQKPHEAAMMAHQLWQQWEKIDKGHEFHKYPDISGTGAGSGIDEEEFQEIWIEAQKHPHKYMGMRENPSAFAYMPKGYDNAKKSIIVPMRSH